MLGPSIKPINQQGYQLLHDGTLALAIAEQRGMCVDVPYLEKQSTLLAKKLKVLQEDILESEEGQVWARAYGKKTNLNSDEQLADVLYNKLGYKAPHKTENDDDAVDKLALAEVGSPLASSMLDYRLMYKAKNTYIDGVLREQVGGILRPSFNLNIAQTYRSSSSNPNFQNQPVRDPWFKKTIRRGFKPRPGYLFLEVDYSGLEVRIAHCYHQDPNMFTYLTDPSKDMHRDMAMQCYLLSIDEWTKNARYASKNKFVFPEFYGSYWGQVAPDLWNAIDQLKLETRQGVPLKKHLASKGIRSFDKYELHIRDVENDFWGNRFGVYGKWKEEHYKFYLKHGYVDCLTGFRFGGKMARNQVINYPVQGAAFHCLLKALIEMVRLSQVEDWKSGVIGQIHDSIVMEVHPSELNRVLATLRRVMTKWLPEQWPWIIVPLDVEIETGPVNGSWYLKKEVKQERGLACPKCGTKWRYEIKDKETGDFLFWNCPVCDNRDETPF